MITLGMTIAVLGLAYEPHSHVIEESQGIDIVKALAKTGTRVVAYDSLANKLGRAELHGLAAVVDTVAESLADADIVLITTPDPEFQTLTADEMIGRRERTISERTNHCSRFLAYFSPEIRIGFPDSVSSHR